MNSRPTISVRNLQRSVRVNINSLEAFAGKALAECLRIRKKVQTELTLLRAVTVLLVSDRRMSWLHRKFLGKSGPTDVLTFQHGEIVISVETAVRNARRFKTSLRAELRLYLVHGLLHLHGFDDQTVSQAKKMVAEQQRIVARTGLN